MTCHLHPVDRMKKVCLLLALLLVGASGLRAQPIPLYENWGTVTFGETAPQIDALAFANYGTFNIFAGSGLVPYDFQNTLHYTNRGVMQASPGFRFDTSYSKGSRVPALSFHNESGSTIAVDSWLSVHADQIRNQGLLSAQAAGMIFLSGGNVNVSRSGLGIQPPQPSGSFVGETNFLTDPDIFDWYWGGLTNSPYDSTDFFLELPDGSFLVQSPQHIVTTATGGLGFTSVGLFNPVSAIHTNQISPTNFVVQAVFVGMPDDNYNANLRFGPPSFVTGLRPIFVELAMTDTNIISDETINHRLYFTDRLASSTNYVMAENLRTGNTFRPAIYELGRTPPMGFGGGGPGNTPIDAALFNNPEFEEGPITNFWAAYGAIISSGGASGIPPWPQASITNTSGRVEIEADVLNLERTRIRANGVVSMKTKHLASSERTVIDSPHLLYQLASTNGTLRIENLAKESVVRQSGTVVAWSALWTNTTFDIEIVPPPDPEGEPTEVTNTIEHIFHALLFDATDMESLQPVTVHQLAATATNIVVTDNMTVVDRFCVDGRHITLDSDILLTGTIRNWTCSNAPSVMFFTNLGSLNFNDIGNFGNDRPDPYTAFVNHGTISGSTHLIHSDYVENGGTLNASGRITLEVQMAKLENGTHNAGGDVIIRGQDVKFHEYTGLTGARLVLDVSQSLSDSGGTANNLLNTGDGFHLLRKPAQGDLLGTSLQTTAPRFSRIDHVWAASDHGAVPEGFFNNVAIGRLALSAGPDAQLSFRGPDNTGSYAIYADFLDLQGGVQTAFNDDDLESVIDLAENVTIYYAYANVPVEQLDGRLDGKFIWVKEFAGPNSSVDVALRSGKTIRVNRGLRESLIIDSNGNGIANGLDPEPFDEPELDVEVTQTEPFITEIRWFAAPHTTYVVEHATAFAGADWQVLDIISNPADIRQPVVVEDRTNDAQSQRYYRVRYQP
jgi:hypothetical protein